jgi:hypothetical protein
MPVRDDLHRSFPLTSPWRKAVKMAGALHWKGRLAEEMSRAAWHTGAWWWDSDWGKAFRSLLIVGQSDMFDQPSQLLDSLKVLERKSPDHGARRACEIARAELISVPQIDIEFLDRVIHSSLDACLQDGIEHCAARVAAEHPDKRQAAELRRRMMTELPQCNLLERPSPKPRPPRKSVDDGLRIHLAATF